MSKQNYYQQVYDVTQMIPEGRVSTYGAIADYLSLGSARMVGWALGKSFSGISGVPAHRVVNSKGELSGRASFSHPDLMQQLLEEEGVKVNNHKVQNFKKLLWKPIDYL